MNGVRTQAAQLDAILQDRDDDRALTSAFELYGRSVHLAHSSIDLALEQEQQMEQMQQGLLQKRDDFTRHSLLFRMLVMNIRTEAARIDADNQSIFNSVALDIEMMEQQMDETTGKAFTQIETMAKEASANRAQMESLNAELEVRAQQSTEVLRHELQKIKVSLLPCATASRRISDLIETARSQTGSLIVSLQYQDIVRQQLEHVTQGFDDISRHIPSAAAEHRTVDVGYLHHVTRVQQNHLSSARGSIEKTCRQLAENSEALLETGSRLSEHFQEMERCASAVLADSRVADLFEAETKHLAQIAHQSELTNQRITRLVERIEESVRVFSTEIVRLELEVKIVALNGQIAAARVPDAGALNKLSEQTAQLAEQTSLLTHAMNLQLGETLAELQRLRDRAKGGHADIARERTSLAEQSVAVSDKLSRLHHRIRQGSGKVATDFESAYREVNDLLDTLTFPKLIAYSFAPAEALCENLFTATAHFATATMSAVGQERLSAHRDRYTMHQERTAHAAALATCTPEKVEASAPVAEFFDDFTPAGAASEPIPEADAKAKPPHPVAALAGSDPSVASTPATTVLATPSTDLGDGVELF